MTREDRTDLKHEIDVRSVAFSPDGKQLACAGYDITRWAVADWSKIAAHDKIFASGRVAFSPDGRHLAAACGSCVRVLDATSGDLVRKLEVTSPGGGASGCVDLAYAPDGHALATGGWQNGELFVWDTTHWGRVHHLLAQHKYQATCVAFSPGEPLVASGGLGENVVTLWDVAAGRELRTLETHGWVLRLAFSPTARFLAAGLNNGRLLVWRMPAGEIVSELRDLGGTVWDLAFSPDGQTLAVGCSGVLLMNLESLTVVGRSGWMSEVKSVAFSPDSNLLASSSGRTVAITDPHNFRPYR